MSFFLAFDFCRFIPATTAIDLRLRRISIPDHIQYIIFLSYFLRKSQYFPFQCWVLKKWTTGTIFINSLVWRGPWLGIEPWTSRTRSKHSTTEAIKEAVILVIILKPAMHFSTIPTIRRTSRFFVIFHALASLFCLCQRSLQMNRLLDSLVVLCWLRVREVQGSIPSHTKDVIKMVPVVPLFSTLHSNWKILQMCVDFLSIV